MAEKKPKVLTDLAEPIKDAYRLGVAVQVMVEDLDRKTREGHPVNDEVAALTLVAHQLRCLTSDLDDLYYVVMDGIETRSDRVGTTA